MQHHAHPKVSAWSRLGIALRRAGTVSSAVTLLLLSHVSVALQLGGTDVPKERIVVYILIGHSNMLSAVDSQPIPGQTYNYVVPDASPRVEGWERAQNPLHISESGVVGWSGPGKPLLQKLAAAHPGYHIGMLQNPNNRSAIRWIDPAPPSVINAVHNRYCDGCGLYNQIMSRAVAMQDEVTFGGIVAMLGFMEAKELGTSTSFAADVATMVAAMRRDLGDPNLPFMIDAGNWDGTNKFTYWETVRDQIGLIEGLVPRSAVVNGNVLPSEYYDRHHYSDVGHAKWATRAVQIIADRGWFPVAPVPELALSPTSLTFSTLLGARDPDARPVGVSNAGTGTLANVTTHFTDAPWLSVSRSGSGNSQSLSNQISLMGLSTGNYTAQVNVACANAANAPVSYRVTLIVDEVLEASSVQVSPTTRSMQADTQATFDATVLDQHGQPFAAMVTWSSSNGGSFSLDRCAMPAAQCQTTFTAPPNAGDLTLTATAGSAQGTASVTVTPPPSIVLERPVGAETWRAGDVENIEWSVQGLTSVWLRYSTDGGAHQTTIDLVNDSDPRWGNFPWTVPDIPTDAAMIFTAGYNEEAPTQSGAFTIEASVVPQTLSLTAPLGGELLVAGDSFDITWTGTGMQGVDVKLSLDAGGSWELVDTVQTVDADWGQLPWIVPTVASAHCLLRVESPGAVAQDTSSAFTIEVPVVITPAELELTRISLSGAVPQILRDVEHVTVDGKSVPVVDGEFTALVSVPLGVRSLSVELSGETNTGLRYARMLRVDVAESEQLIPGLAVSERQLRAFVGDRGGVLTWVDDAGQIKLLDFRGADPQVQTLVPGPDHVNPLLSPDGTRLVYSVGSPSGPKEIHALRIADGASHSVGTGDLGYWSFAGGDQAILYCDWSEPDQSGADGNTYLLPLDPGSVDPSAAASLLHDRAMDAGANGDRSWLGQVYKQPYAYHVATQTEYAPDDFVLMDGSPGSGQTCNGSMAPDGSARMMALTIPHDWVRVFSFDEGDGVFRETSRMQLPPTMVEWVFPEWSTDPNFFTAGMHRGDLRPRLHLVKRLDGDGVPEVLPLTTKGDRATYSHLYLD